MPQCMLVISPKPTSEKHLQLSGFIHVLTLRKDLDFKNKNKNAFLNVAVR